METKAKGKYLRMSTIKLAPVAKLIRGKSVSDAEMILKFKAGKASVLIEEVLGAAKANAENNNNLNPDHLYVKHISIGQGPTLKRWRAGARGGVAPILKRTSHINIVLDESEELKKAFPEKSRPTKKPESEIKASGTPEEAKKEASETKDSKDKTSIAGKNDAKAKVSTAKTEVEKKVETKPADTSKEKAAADKKEEKKEDVKKDEKTAAVKDEVKKDEVKKDEKKSTDSDKEKAADKKEEKKEVKEAKETKEKDKE